jgi:hypothetical protein
VTNDHPLGDEGYPSGAHDDFLGDHLQSLVTKSYPLVTHDYPQGAYNDPQAEKGNPPAVNFWLAAIHQRKVCRRMDGSYHFLHKLLQEYLARQIGMEKQVP